MAVPFVFARFAGLDPRVVTPGRNTPRRRVLVRFAGPFTMSRRHAVR